MRRSPAEVSEWLRGNPSLDELRDAFPADWDAVVADLGGVMARGEMEELAAVAARVSKPPSRARARSSAERDALLASEVQRRMAAAALAQHRLSVSTGVRDGTVRFGLVNGWILQ